MKKPPITKKALTEYLQEKGLYNSVDTYLINEFYFNLQLVEETKETIEKVGSVMNISRDPEKPYYQQNPAITIYNKALKTLLDISRKLALSPYDREKLGLEMEDKEDDLF